MLNANGGVARDLGTVPVKDELVLEGARGEYCN